MNRGGQLRLSEMDDLDEAMLRLYGHPLVRPGMTMAQVEGLIVFANELLDPPPAVEEDGLQLAKRAYAAFVEAGSARFRVQGGWAGGRGCSDHTFAGSHKIGGFGNGDPDIVHFDSDAGSVFLRYSESAGWRNWRQTQGMWREVDSISSDVTYWREGFTDPVDMLISVIRHANADSIEVTRPSAARAELNVTLNDAKVVVRGARGLTLRVSVTLDTQTYEVSRYKMHWQFDFGSRNFCSAYDVTATNGEYGVEIPIPDAIAADGDAVFSAITNTAITSRMVSGAGAGFIFDWHFGRKRQQGRRCTSRRGGGTERPDGWMNHRRHARKPGRNEAEARASR